MGIRDIKKKWGMKMKNDSQFVVRLPKEDLDKFNEVLKEKAINRSELFRIWVKKFIEENS